MPNILIGVYGASGFGREVLPLVRNQIRKDDYENRKIVFIDDNPKTTAPPNPTPVYSYNEFLQERSKNKYIVIAIGNSHIRRNLAEKHTNDNIQPLNIISDTTIIYDNNLIGEGSILCANTTVTSNAKIGKYFHANIYSYIAHDCIIGDYVTFAPNVMCNGNVNIGSHSYIGTGAILKQGMPEKPLLIGEGAVIGMGAVVTKDVPPYTTVVGNPAKPLLK